MLHVYLDESGDLGWSLAAPYRKGGSSRFLTVACLLVTAKSCDYPKRQVRRLKHKYGISPSRELKGCELTADQLLFFATQAAAMISSRDGISLRAITVMKENVQGHIRSDPNKLYNYMVNLCLLEAIDKEADVLFTPDPRSIKVTSGDSMIDYLQTQLWFDRAAKTVLHHEIHESHKNLNIQFVDVVAHIVWAKHENGDSAPFQLLAAHVSCKSLFFH